MSTCFNPNRYSHHGSSLWFAKYPLLGRSEWRNEYQRANIAFEIITVLALLGILIWALTGPKRSSTARNLFIWFTAAVSFATLNFAWNFIDAILHEEQVYAEQLYIIFDVIFFSLRYVAEILLLAAVLTLMISCMAVAANTNPRTTSRASAAQLALCGVLGVFWLVILALRLTFYIQCVEGTGNHFRQIINAVLKLNFVYDLLCLIVVFGILIWSTVLLISSTSGNGVNRKIPTVFLVGISVFLFIRQIWTTIIDGIYYLSLPASIYRNESEKVWLANQIFYYICTIVAYAALAAIISRLQVEPAAAEDMYQAYPISQLATPQPSWKRESLGDHSQDPIYNGPVVRDV